MDLNERLHEYEVTAVPRRARLHLVWSLPPGGGKVADDAVPAGGEPVAAAACAPLAILADYRITRVPSRAAS